MKGTIINEAIQDIESCEDIRGLNKVRKKYLGPTGIITTEMLRIPSLSYNIRLTHSKTVLQLQESFNNLFDKKKKQLNK